MSAWHQDEQRKDKLMQSAKVVPRYTSNLQYNQSSRKKRLRTNWSEMRARSRPSRFRSTDGSARTSTHRERNTILSSDHCLLWDSRRIFGSSIRKVRHKPHPAGGGLWICFQTVAALERTSNAFQHNLLSINSAWHTSSTTNLMSALFVYRS